MKRALCLVTALTTLLTSASLYAQQPPGALWTDRFKPFRTVDQPQAEPTPDLWQTVRKVEANVDDDGRLTLADASGQGWSRIHALRPYKTAFRYLQIDYADNRIIEGYQFLSMTVSAPATRQSQSILTLRTGIYTFDTWTVDALRQGKASGVTVALGLHGSGRDDDGTLHLGSVHNLRWMRLVQTPLDGLAVTMADGAPLKPALKLGDALRLEMHLAKPAHDVTVDMMHDYRYRPALISGQPYVQLKKVDGNGRHWRAEVTLEKGTTLFPKREPRVFFRALVADGRIWKSWYGTSLAITK